MRLPVLTLTCLSRFIHGFVGLYKDRFRLCRESQGRLVSEGQTTGTGNLQLIAAARQMIGYLLIGKRFYS